MSKCEYSIHIKGNKQSALMFCAITKRIGDLHIDFEQQLDDEKAILWISGTCASDKDLYGWREQSVNIDPSILTEQQIRDGIQLDDFLNLSLRRKSEMLGLELFVRVRSKEDDYDQVEHYKSGFFVGIIGDVYKENNDFEFDF